MYFIKKDIFRKKLIIFSFIVAVYLFAILNFSIYVRSYASYKPYYLGSQMTALSYRTSSVLSAVTSFVLFKKENSTASAATPPSAQSIPVLLYHGILNKTDGVNVDDRTFNEHMFTLKKAGYHTVSLDDFYLFLQGKKELPEKSFLLTFDDGRKDSYYPANPILKALDFNAVMFAIAKFSQQDKSNYYLTKDEIKNMSEGSTWEIESHTRTHRNLGEVPPEELPDEIIGSKQDLENITGKQIIAFAFPFGELGQEPNDQSSDESKKQIMQLAKAVYPMSFFQYFTYKRFTQNYPDPEQATSNYLVRRIEPKPEWSGTYLLSLLQSGSAKSLPWHALFDPADGWVNTLWGDMMFSNGKFIVTSLGNTTGSAVVLDGSAAWKNYQFNTHIVSSSGSNAYLWARYQDDENHAACNFGQNLVHVEQTVDGVTEVIKGNQLLNNLDLKNVDVAIRVSGRKVDCLIDGQIAVETAYLNPKLDKGGVGLKVWDQTPGRASMTVSSVLVDALPEDSP